MIVLLLFALSLGVAVAQETIDALRTGGPTIKKWTAVVIVLVGVWQIFVGGFPDFWEQTFGADLH